MARWLAPVFAVLTFAVPAAQAKAPASGVKVCGATTCASIAPADAERMGVWGVSSAVAPGTPAPYYVLRYRWRAEDPEQTSYWIPSAGLFRTVSPNLVSWFRVPRDTMERVSAGIEPMRIPSIVSATVAGRRVEAPGTYIRVFFAGRATNVWPASTWLRMRFKASAVSPWTDPTADVRIATSGNYLLRDDTVFVIPKRLANRIRRGLALTG